MLRWLKKLVLAFKPISDAEAMAMNLNGPTPPKEGAFDDPDVEMGRDGQFWVKPEAVDRRRGGPPVWPEE